ncbi:MAG TPA: thioredoxin [Thermoanaerobaculia bacterium]|nr:thioredoxin [Thermoanaerobaculia bacterium]
MAEVVSCSHCGANNRVGTPPPGAVPRCGRCKEALPWLVEADDASFPREVAAPVPVLVDFWAAWCGPCRTVAPIVEEIARQRAGRLKVVKVDVDHSPRTAHHHRVSSIPVLALFRGGRVVERITGARPLDALLHQIDPHLPPPPSPRAAC